MEPLIALGLLCALAVLAARWGVDSRESLASKEEQLAALGVTWDPALRRPTPGDGALTLEAWSGPPGLVLASDRMAEYRREVEMARLARLVTSSPDGSHRGPR